MIEMKRASEYPSFFVFSAIILLGLSFVFPVTAAVSEEVSQKNAQIEEIQRQIEKYQQEIDAAHGKATTLQGEVNSLNAQINQINLELKSFAISISRTNLQISETQNSIEIAEEKIGKNQKVLAQSLRIMHQTDQETLTGILIKNNSLSDFFTQLNSLRTIQDDLRVTIDNIIDLKSSLETQKQDLEDKKADLSHQQSLVAIEQKSVAQIKAKKDKLLADTKGQESKYQELVKKSKKDIEAIRSQISYLEQNGVTAEDAVKYGQLAAIGAGIRPAFLLAELNQESAMGGNVGKCYITDATSGTTKSIVNGHVYTKGIHPTRDLPLFLKITAELGRDPFKTPVSCAYGWGGAMGPAQFIPSTWMGYRDQVSRLTGHSPANPWSIQDSFTAAAAKLSKDGANSGTRAGEIAASKRYYCGSASSTNSVCINYANSVQRLAQQIEPNL